MKFMLKIIALLIFTIVVFSMLFSIHVEKYQKEYFTIIKQIQNKPQEHLDRQYKYAENFEKYDTFYPETEQKQSKPKVIQKTQQKTQTHTERKHYTPLYIRDKNNPNILHPYKKQKRKFIF